MVTTAAGVCLHALAKGGGVYVTRRRISSRARRLNGEASPRSASVFARPQREGVDVTRRLISFRAHRDQRPSARDPPPLVHRCLRSRRCRPTRARGSFGGRCVPSAARDVAVSSRRLHVSRACRSRSLLAPPRPSRVRGRCGRSGHGELSSSLAARRPTPTQTRPRPWPSPARACSTLSAPTISASTVIPAARGRSPRCAHDGASHEGHDDGSFRQPSGVNVQSGRPFVDRQES